MILSFHKTFDKGYPKLNANPQEKVELVAQPQLNEKTKRMLAREIKEIKEGKNVSPRFKTAAKMIAYLKNDNGNRVA